MSMAERPRIVSRIRAVAVGCVRVVLGPFSDKSKLDRNQAGPAGGVLVLVAVGLPVASSSAWVVAVSIVAGVVGAALIIKSLQRPRVMVPEPSPQGQSQQDPLPGQVQPDEAASTQVASPPGINVTDSTLTKSGIDIPEGSQASVDHSELNESPLTIRQRSRSNSKPDGEIIRPP
jgi:hypothetical protein